MLTVYCPLASQLQGEIVFATPHGLLGAVADARLEWDRGAAHSKNERVFEAYEALCGHPIILDAETTGEMDSMFLAAMEAAWRLDHAGDSSSRRVHDALRVWSDRNAARAGRSLYADAMRSLRVQMGMEDPEPG